MNDNIRTLYAKFETMIEDEEDYVEPRIITYASILAAKRRLTAVNHRRTPCVYGHLGEKFDMQLYYKSGFDHYTGSLKERGICNALCMLTDEQKKIGVVSASIGNFGIAMAYQAAKFGIPCYVVMASCVSFVKLDKCVKLIGDRLIVKGSNFTEAKKYARELAKKENMLFIDGYDDPSIIEGQGTCAIEMMEQVQNIDAVIVPVGSGGLITGVSVACKHLSPNIKVYGVSTNKTFAVAEALRQNKVVKIPLEPSVADALSIERAGTNAFHNLKKAVDKLIIVDEEWVIRAIALLMEEECLVLEGAGAVPVAAIMAGLFPQLKNKKVICILSGGNIEIPILAKYIERSLSYDGKLAMFKVALPDQPSSLENFGTLLSGIGIRIHDIITKRSYLETTSLYVELQILVETNGPEHLKELKVLINKTYKTCHFYELDEMEPKSAKRGPCLASVCFQK